MSHSSVDGNTAVELGGGVRGEVDAADSSISGNLVTGPFGVGGGLSAPWRSYRCFDPPPAAARISLVSCQVRSNWVLAGEGGGIGTAGGFGGCGVPPSVEVINSLVADNQAPYTGGIEAFGPVTVRNSTVTRNTSTSSSVGGLLAFDSTYSYVANSIFFDNGASSIHFQYGDGDVRNSLVQGGWPGPGNLDADPLFFDPSSADYRLRSTSPCLDAGDNTAVPPGLTTDLRGAPRFIDDPFTPDSGLGAAPVVDMGAYEFFRRFHDARGVPVAPAPPRTVP
jgi:hypothetical protein